MISAKMVSRSLGCLMGRFQKISDELIPSMGDEGPTVGGSGQRCKLNWNKHSYSFCQGSRGLLLRIESSSNGIEAMTASRFLAIDGRLDVAKV